MKNDKKSDFKAPSLVVTEDTIRSLSPAEQIIAKILIDTGRWTLVKKDEN